ncbi:polyadenylate-binding protein 6-like [Rutidosis leptorrhynchoides]|uniref:polyadenylate-binding protein 6-like n=1 Tax=Rutidosis leptorrhynchoides TaxID=125765 RepID=UPI003A99C212
MAIAMQSVFPIPTPPAQLFLPPALLPATLYVGDLHSDTTENDLYTLFSKIGPLSSVRICRDRVSYKSLCYGYVNFKLTAHADAALSKLNHTEMRGKPMRIMWCQRDPFTRRTGLANLFVKNIDSLVTDVKLEEAFAKFGTILSCKIAKDNQGKSKGFGFVQFDSEESANNALNALDGSTLGEKIISVAKFLKKSERKEPEFTNLYVKNLDSDFTEDLLKDKFSEYGNVTSAVIMKDADGKSKGFGFVNFDSPDSAKMAIEALNGAIIGFKEWFVGKALKKSEREGLKLSTKTDKISAANLFVRNLAASVDEKALEETFGVFGKIVLTKVVRDKSGASKGFGFVCFSNSEAAKNACDSLNGKLYHQKYMIITAAMSKEECTRHLQARIASQQNFGSSQYLPPYYGLQSYGRTPVYDPYWPPNVYTSMQVLPTYKSPSHQGGVHLSYNKVQKPVKGLNACFSKGLFAKQAYQNLSVKRSRVLLEIKSPKVMKSRKAFLKKHVKNEVGADEGGLGLHQHLAF